jgi:peptidoglycan/xylan/chitin deacetylase (PgdA/CDA1 family)
MVEAYHADNSWRGKIRRRAVRLAARRPARAPTGPMISFCFDDAPASAAEAGAAILERRGLKGSYFIAAAMAGTDVATGRMADATAVRRLADAGHEVGCHTYSHLDCGQATAEDAVEDVARNAATLAGRFALMRALHPGLVTAGADLNQAPAIGVEGADGEAHARRWLNRARGRKAWLILYTHDVAEDPTPWGCTPAALERLADTALGAGFEVVTVAEGARRVNP